MSLKRLLLKIGLEGPTRLLAIAGEASAASCATNDAIGRMWRISMIWEPAPPGRWDHYGAALLGASIGIGGVLAHEAYDIVQGQFGGTDNPFLHILVELLVFGISGAVLFAAVALFLNRRVRD
jgi:hypothetical protein